MNKLPDGWEIKKLKDILSNEKYSIKRGPFGSSLKKEFFIKEGVKVFEQYNPINNDPHWCRYRIDKKKYEELKAFSCRAGDFLISCSGTLGKILLLPDNVEEGIINQALLKIRLNNKLVDNYYFLNLFQYEDFQKRIYIDAVGSAIHNIASVNILKEMDVIIPPLDEQKRIASALSKIDAYLENTIKLIEEKERFKRGIAKKLLTCKEGENIPEARFKGFNDDWRKEKLSSMIKIQGGYAFKSSEFKKSGIPIIRISNISNTDNNINMKEVVYYNEIENEKSFIIKKSDLLIALSGAPGKSSIYNLEEKAYLNQRVGLFKIIDTKKINNSFLYQYVFSSIFQNKLKPFITRGVQPNISPKDIENLDILLPSLKEQEKIGGYLSLLDAEIDNLKKQKELIKEMKRGAMQKLLSGEVRLSKNAFNENI